MAQDFLSITDASGASIKLPRGVNRVVSLVPSITESVIELAGPDVLAARTRYCIHPAEIVKTISKVGGTKDPNLEAIIELKPDLVLANREENRKEDIDALRAAGLLVYVNEPRRIEDVWEMLTLLGYVFAKEEEAASLVQEGCSALRDAPASPTTVAVPIWRDPWMLAGRETFIAGMLCAIGLLVVSCDPGDRYGECSVESLVDLDADLILLPSEPWHFKESDREFLRDRFQSAGKQPRIELVSGEDLMWFGTRTPGALRRLGQQLL